MSWTTIRESRKGSVRVIENLKLLVSYFAEKHLYRGHEKYIHTATPLIVKVQGLNSQ